MCAKNKERQGYDYRKSQVGVTFRRREGAVVTMRKSQKGSTGWKHSIIV